MPRKKATEYDEQIYKLPEYGEGTQVTVRFDKKHPPPFWQPGPGVVIVGDHACAAPGRIGIDEAPEVPRVYAPSLAGRVQRGGNFKTLPPAELEQRREELMGGGGRTPAPPGASVVPFTSEDVFRQMTGGKVDLQPGELENGLAMAAAAKDSQGE